jgi:hypothetical protein
VALTIKIVPEIATLLVTNSAALKNASRTAPSRRTPASAKNTHINMCWCVGFFISTPVELSRGLVVADMRAADALSFG